MKAAKVLTLRQPWLELVLAGHKTIETRTWQTKFRGRLYLHASAKKPSAKERAAVLAAVLPLVEPARREAVRAICEDVELVRGKVQGFADLQGVQPYTQAAAAGGGLYPYTQGERRFSWLIANVERTPVAVPWRGALTLQTAPMDLIARTTDVHAVRS